MSASSLPLRGVRVVEMCWVWSGPMMGQYLADLGAEVIKVEWYDRFDLYRTRGVERLRGKVPEEVRREMSFSFHSLNRGKLGFAADLKREAGREALSELIRSSDILLENFTLGTLERLGFGLDALREMNERLVVVSLSASGAGSSVEALRAYGLVISALGGAEALFTNSAGSFLGSPTFVLSDPNAAAFGAFASVAGLLHAARSGSGHSWDASQIEAVVSLMMAKRTEVSSRRPLCNRVVKANDGEYVAATFATDGALAADGVLEAAARDLDAEALVDHIEAAGAFGAVVRSLEGTEELPEFAGTDVRHEVLHPVTGAEKVVSAPWRVNGVRPYPRKPAPQLGESNDYVLRRVLGFDDDKIADMKSHGGV